MIADMEANKTSSSIVSELFLILFNNEIVFISQSYLHVPRTIRLNMTHFFSMKVPNKRELQQIAL